MDTCLFGPLGLANTAASSIVIVILSEAKNLWLSPSASAEMKIRDVSLRST